MQIYNITTKSVEEVRHPYYAHDMMEDLISYDSTIDYNARLNMSCATDETIRWWEEYCQKDAYAMESRDAADGMLTDAEQAEMAILIEQRVLGSYEEDPKIILDTVREFMTGLGYEVKETMSSLYFLPNEG